MPGAAPGQAGPVRIVKAAMRVALRKRQPAGWYADLPLTLLEPGVDKLVKHRPLAFDPRSDAVAEQEHRAFMDGPRWVYARGYKTADPSAGGAVGDGDADLARQLGRDPVGQRLKAFLRKLVGRQNG